MPILKPAIVALSAAVLITAPAWSLQTSGVMATLRGVSAVTDMVAWASGSGSTILRTGDGGATWAKLLVTGDRLDFRDVDAIDERTAYALSIGNGPQSRIYKTTDAGATWALQFTNDDARAFFDAMAFWDADHGIVVGDSIDNQFCIMTTGDGGKTWTRVAPGVLPPALDNEGAFAASGTNVTVLGSQEAWFATGAGARARVLRTRDRGRTWAIAETPIPAGASAGIYSIAFRDARHGLIVGGDYRKEAEAIDNVARTEDGGATWTVVKAPALGGFRSVVAYMPGTPMTAVAVGPSGSDITTDDGQTWTAIAGPGFHTFSFARGRSMGWGAGGRGAIGLLTQPPGR